MCAGSLRGQIGLLRGEVLGGQLLPPALGHLLHHLVDTACRRCCLLLQQRCISKERCISLALRPGTSAAILDKGCSSRPCSRQAGYRSRCALPNHGEEADEHRCDQQQRLSMLLQLAVRTIQMEHFSRAGHVRHCFRVLCCRAAGRARRAPRAVRRHPRRAGGAVVQPKPGKTLGRTDGHTPIVMGPKGL